MYQPLISIVIPVYNGGEFLREAIDSALSQTYPNREVLVVNDGSDDGGVSRETALSYGDRVRYFEKSNGGVSSALNLAVANMRGEWFCWLSHDDVYLPHKLECQAKQLRALLDEGKDLDRVALFSGMEWIDASGRVAMRLPTSPGRRGGNLGIMLRNLRRSRMGGCTFLLPRSCFDRLGGFDEELRCVSDVDYWYRLLLSGCELHYLPEILVRGRLHGGQVTQRAAEKLKKEQEIFHIRVIRALYSRPEYRRAGVFLRVGSYAARRGLTSAILAFSMAAKLLPPLLARPVCSSLYRLNRFYGRFREGAKAMVMSRLLARGGQS